MKKKILYAPAVMVVVVLIAVSAILIYNAYSIHSDTQRLDIPQSHASWAEHYYSVESLIKASDLIVTGTVVGAEVENRHGLLFTNQEIHIEKVYQGDVRVGDSIRVLQTGGVMDGFESGTFLESPLFEIGDFNLMFLRYTDEGHFLVMGGYQGLGRIDKDSISFAVSDDVIAQEFARMSYRAVDRYIDERVSTSSRYDVD